MNIRFYPMVLGMALSAGTVILVTGCNREETASPNASIPSQRATAATVGGVKDVKNDTTLNAEKLPVGENQDDSIITAKVKAALLAEASVKGVEISVATSKGAVQLSGFLDDQAQVDRAIDVARNVDGVRDVASALSVRK
ncbi:MAG: BON domain-containing protein [Woeseia sp.]